MLNGDMLLLRPSNVILDALWGTELEGMRKKQGGHPRAYPAILRRDNGGSPRMAAGVVVVRGSQILDAFCRNIQEDFL